MLALRPCRNRPRKASEDLVMNRHDFDEGVELWEKVRAWGKQRNTAAVPQLLALASRPDEFFPEDEKIRRIATWALGRMGFEVLAVHADLADASQWLAREG